MSKTVKILILVGCIILALIIIGVLYDNGYLNFRWTTLTEIFAALAAPFMFIKNKFFNANSATQLQDLLETNAEGKINDLEHRKTYDAQIDAKEKEIEELQTKVNNLNNKLANLESEQANVSAEIKTMSSDEIEAEFEKIYGNLKDE